MSSAPYFAAPIETTPENFGKLFLKYPDLFPARQAGEPWDDESLIVDFAGGPYEFLGLTGGQKQDLVERFGDMALERSALQDGLPITRIKLFRTAADELLDVKLAGWSYTFDRDYQEQAVRVAGLKFMARIDFDPDGADPSAGGLSTAGLSAALWTPLDGGSIFLSQVENFFRLVVAYRLLKLGGVLFHSAGVASNGKGYLFLGHSGAGKTTISRLSLTAGRTVLSDDMNALCPLGSGEAAHTPTVEKLPFAGDLGRTPAPRRRYPLAGLFRLKQGSHHLRPIRRAQAVAFLIGCAPFVNVDPHRIDRLTDNLLALLEGFPMAELTFSKDGDVWSLLDDEFAPPGPATGAHR